jgi:hypothetical protein
LRAVNLRGVQILAAAVVFVIIGLFCLYSWLIITGRKAMIFNIPSFASVEVCKAIAEQLSALNRSELKVADDGVVERVYEVALHLQDHKRGDRKSR